MKKVDLTDLDNETIKQLIEEASLLEKVEDTSFIIQLFSYKITEDFALLFLEPCLCGDLWSLMQTRGALPEEDAKFYVGCVIEGLEHLQKLEILFRDLKPENMLLGEDGYVKIADFGMSKILTAGEKTNTLVGTAEYLAPEMLTSKEGYDDRATLWSLGILLFELLTGSPPFTHSNRSQLFSKITLGFKRFCNRIEKVVNLGKFTVSHMVCLPIMWAPGFLVKANPAVAITTVSCYQWNG